MSNNPRNKIFWLGRWGLLATAAYLGLLAYWLIYYRRAELLALELNEFGDFLAGSLGPLALLWIIISFYQQGKELKNSVDALRLQSEELSKSVAQQEKLNEIALKQYNEDTRRHNDQIESSRPRFTLSAGAKKQNRDGTMFRSYELTCFGSAAVQVLVEIYSGGKKVKSQNLETVTEGDSRTISIDADPKKIRDSMIEIRIDYLSSFGHHYRTVYTASLNEAHEVTGRDIIRKMQDERLIG